MLRGRPLRRPQWGPFPFGIRRVHLGVRLRRRAVVNGAANATAGERYREPTLFTVIERSR
jgi:hypothetical protein